MSLRIIPNHDDIKIYGRFAISLEGMIIHPFKKHAHFQPMSKAHLLCVLCLSVMVLHGSGSCDSELGAIRFVTPQQDGNFNQTYP